jgi:putative ABC transport system substrate-binding protein
MKGENMGFVKFRLLTVLLLMAFLICALPLSSYAEGKNVLMFLWQGETGAEKGFKEALGEEFHDQNINYTMLDCYKDINRLRELIQETDESKYDLIYTYGSTITSKVIKEYQKTPIVFNKVLDPITYKIIDNWDQKQPNLTGASISIPTDIQIKKIQEVLGVGNMGLIFNPLDKNSVELKDEMESILESKGLELVACEFTQNFNSLKGYMDRVKDRVVCIYLPTERQVVGFIQRIFSETNRRKIPTCVTSTSTLRRGGLLCISADYSEVGKLAGKQAARILKGAKPEDLPVLRPTESEIRLYANTSVVKRFKTELPKDLDINYIK